MGNLHLVTGYSGTPHITAEDHGTLNASIVGSGHYVLPRGNAFSTTIISNNLIRVSDGELMMQGRHVRLAPGSYVDVTIENGASGVQRVDLIVARYTKNTSTGVESCNLIVLKGTSSGAPEIEDDTDLLNGEATVHDMALYSVLLNGLNIKKVTPLFSVRNIALNDLADSKLDKTGGTMSGVLNMGSKRIVSVATPTLDTDAANKGYVDDSIESPVNRIANLENKVAALPKILFGTAAITYDTLNADNTVDVSFSKAFNTIPAVIVSQPFNTANITVLPSSVTKTGFTAVLAEVFTTTGEKNFMWVAIGT